MVSSKHQHTLVPLDTTSDNQLPLYEQVVETIRGLIDNGSLQPGDKAPSIRSLHKELRVSMATVVQAYSILEAQGVIESRPRSGFYVSQQSVIDLPMPQKTSPSQISKRITINEIVVALAELGHDPDMTNLGIATLVPDMLPHKQLKRIMSSVVRHSNANDFYYDMVPGDPVLLKQLARRSIRWQCRLSADDFVITNGAMESMHLAIRTVAKPGDTIAIESPTYYPILQTLENLGMYALEIPTDPRSGMDLDALESALNKKKAQAVFVIPNFNNPLGFMMEDEDKKRLVAMTAERGIPVIEDDIYGDLHFEATRPAPLKAYDREGLVLHCSSLSKSLSSGLRVGWIAPGQFKEDIKRYKHFTNVSAPTLSQLTLAECLRSGTYDRHLMQLRPALKNSMSMFFEAISRYFPAGTQVSRPKGGFLLWVVLPEQVDITKLYQMTIEHKVSIAPGPIFSAAQEYTNCFRLSCGRPWSNGVDWAMKLIGNKAHELMK